MLLAHSTRDSKLSIKMKMNLHYFLPWYVDFNPSSSLQHQLPRPLVGCYNQILDVRQIMKDRNLPLQCFIRLVIISSHVCRKHYWWERISYKKVDRTSDWESTTVIGIERGSTAGIGLDRGSTSVLRLERRSMAVLGLERRSTAALLG